MKKILAFALMVTALFTSCVEDNIYSVCSITDIHNSIAYTEADEVQVTATVTSLVGVDNVVLNYQVNSGKIVNQKMTKSSGDLFEGAIPAQPVDTKVDFFIEATSSEGEISTSATVTYTVGQVPINYDGLVLNELNGNDKFIELYNKGTEDIPLYNCNIHKDHGEDPTWVADNRILKPGEYLLLYSEDVVIGGEAHEGYDPALVFHSGFSAKKAVCIELKNPAGNLIDCFDLVEKPAKPAAASYTRVPDGTGNWFHTAATPGAPNEKDDSQPVEGLAK